MKKLIAFFLSLLLVIMPCFAEDAEVEDAAETAVESFDNGYDISIPESWTLEELMGWFIESYGLTTDNFSVAIWLPESGESYAFNDGKQMFAASTYKLPLNMYYYEREAEGVYSSDTVVGGVPLSTCHYQSIVWSNNELSQAMIYHLGSFYTYKYLLLEAYGGMDASELDANYWADNYYCTRFMCNTLSYLYEHQDSFTELLGYMEEAMPGQYLKMYAGDTAVAHKYGVFFDPVMQNDVGILYAEEPVLVAIYTQSYAGHGITGEGLIGRIGKALINYQAMRVERDRLAAEEAARIAAEEAAAAEAERQAQQAAEQAAREAEEAARLAEIAASEAAASEAAAQAAREAEEAARREAEQKAANRRLTLTVALTVIGLALVLAGVKIFLRQKKKQQAKVG